MHSLLQTTLLLFVCRPPDAIKEIVGLSSKRCIPCEGGDVPKLSESDVERLKKQVPGWKLAVDQAGVQCIRQEWKVRDFAAGLQLFARIAEVAEEQGHHPGASVLFACLCCYTYHCHMQTCIWRGITRCMPTCRRTRWEG